MRLRSGFLTICLVLFGATTAVCAEPIDNLRLPRDKIDARPITPPRKATANPCAQYGPGFGRIAGSDSCVKIGGSISVGVGVGGSTMPGR